MKYINMGYAGDTHLTAQLSMEDFKNESDIFTIHMCWIRQTYNMQIIF